MKKTFLNIATVAITTLSLFSCHKKSEDPTPIIENKNTNPTDTTKKKPIVVITPKDTTKKDSNVVVITPEKKLEFIESSKPILTSGNLYEFSLDGMVLSDSSYWDFKAISLDKEFTVLRNGNRIAVKSPSSNIVYAGDVVLSITLTSGKRTVTKNITVQIGYSKQVATYEMMKPYFGKLLGGTINNFYIFTDGNINSNANGNFYGDGGNIVQNAYRINDNGNIVLSGSNLEYKVEIGNGYLYFTSIINTSYKIKEKIVN